MRVDVRLGPACSGEGAVPCPSSDTHSAASRRSCELRRQSPSPSRTMPATAASRRVRAACPAASSPCTPGRHNGVGRAAELGGGGGGGRKRGAQPSALSYDSSFGATVHVSVSRSAARAMTGLSERPCT